MPKDTAVLTIPNDTSYLPVVSALVTAAAAQLGFDEADTGDIRLAVDEACAHVIETAFEPGEEQDLTISCRRDPSGLHITIADKGLPFDPASIQAYDAGGGLDRDLSGLPFYLMQQAMDEVHFVNKGWAGKELQLAKYLKVPAIEAYFSQEELRPYDVQVAPAPPSTYQYRLMAPEDAVEVARCVYRTYGRTYPGEQIYFPERVVAMNQSGEMVSAVAVTGSGEVIGHAALSGQPGDRVMEVGQAVVVPAHRGRGILKGLLDLVMGEARRRGLAGLFVRAVTVHPFSQRVSLKYGFQESAVLLGYAGRERQMKGFADQQLPQRESLVHSYYPLQDEPSSLAYPPPHHRDMIARIYRNLGLARELAPPGTGRPDGEAGPPPDDRPRYRLSTQVVPALEIAVMAVTGYGPGIELEVKGKLGELCREGIVTVYLHLPLGDSHTALLCERFEGLGFFFSGILPMPLDAARGRGAEGPAVGAIVPCKDLLCLQYLYGPHIDYDLLQIHSDFCQGLVRYIRAQDPLA